MIYLDNAASTPLDPRVLAAMLPWYLDRPGNASSRHAAGGDHLMAVEQAREQVASLIGAQPSEIVFTSGATEANNWVLRWGHAVQVTQIEHSSIVRPSAWSMLPVDGEGMVDLASLVAGRVAGPHTLSVGWVNNEIGTIQPIHEIAHWCRKRDVLFHSDAAQALGRVPLDLGHLPGPDLVSLSAHKIYGPQGVGALYIRDGVSCEPMFRGGGQERGRRAGTLPTALIVGFGKACEIVEDLFYSPDGRALDEMYGHLLTKGLTGRAGAQVLGPPLGTIPVERIRVRDIVNLRFPGVDTAGLLGAIPELCASTGSACDSTSTSPSHVLQAIGAAEPDGPIENVRFSTGRFTTEEDIERAVELIVDALPGHRR